MYARKWYNTASASAPSTVVSVVAKLSEFSEHDVAGQNPNTIRLMLQKGEKVSPLDTKR